MSMPTKAIWVATNIDRRGGRANSMYASVVLPFVTTMAGLPVAIEDPEDAFVLPAQCVPIPAGVVAVTVRSTSAWHGIGDGLAIPVPLAQLGLGLARDGMPDGLRLRIDDGLHHPARGDAIERWLVKAADAYEPTDSAPRVSWETIQYLIESYRRIADAGGTI